MATRLPYAPPSPTKLASVPRPAILAILEDAQALAERLLQVLDEEAVALDAMKLDAPAALIEIKSRLIAAYEIRMEEIQEAPRPLPAEAASLLETLRGTNKQVLKAAEANGVALQAALDANRQVVDIILRAAGEQQRRDSGVGYGRVGMRPAARTPAPIKGAMVATRL